MSKKKKTKAKTQPPAPTELGDPKDLTNPLVSLRPGVLLSLRVSHKGGASYTQIDREQTTDKVGAEVTRWKTERRIEDPEEYERGSKLRNKCRTIITGACLQTPFGLICPLDQIKKLNDAMQTARATAAQFNSSAKHSWIVIGALRGKIEQNDTEAMRAIGTELKDLLRRMKEEVSQANPTNVRDLAWRAKQLGGMLEDTQQTQIDKAVKAARKAASEIAKRVEKQGEETAAVLATLKLEELELNRFAWLEATDGAPTTPLKKEENE